MKAPLVAIIGRRMSEIYTVQSTDGQPQGDCPRSAGITRDRMFGEVEWRAQMFRLVDTGGIVPDDDAVIPSNIFKQASNAIENPKR